MSNTTWHGRWSHLRKVLERGGPLAHPDFQASSDTLDFLLENCKVSIIIENFHANVYVELCFFTDFGSRSWWPGV